MGWGCRLLQAIHKSVLKSEGSVLHSPVVQLLHILTELCSSEMLNGMKALVELWFVTLVTSDLLIIHCWRDTAHSYSWPLHVAWVFSTLCFTCMHLWLSQSLKNILTTCKISRISQFLQDISSPPKESETEAYPSLSLPRVWLYSGTWKMCHLCSSLFCSWSELRVTSRRFSDKIITFC